MPLTARGILLFWPGIRAVNNDFFVVWEWDISKQGSTTDDSDGGGNESSYESLLEEDKSENEFDSHDEEEQSIGCVREAEYQNTLCAARDLITQGEFVPVRLNPEPTNIKDARAIAIECNIIKNSGKKIGYVVKELLDDVPAAINRKEIVSVKFGWIKYITDWTRLGPGYFAGIKISKSGDWMTGFGILVIDS